MSNKPESPASTSPSATHSEFEKYMKVYSEYKVAALSETSGGSVAGFAAGQYTRKWVKTGIFVTLGLFAATQVLSMQGYINVQWHELETHAVNLLDQNNNGKLDLEDMQILYKKYTEATEYRVPSSAGFFSGFLLGLKGKSLFGK